ncbi:hypothetical protein VTN77DRAFT_8485 [Rasamsonia byssochlamydoides]|uniref:uncharacterized protein n=1 Tax=Rasamsonia byssochlamydoides TaxID=89139 RepID=UPI0037445022
MTQLDIGTTEPKIPSSDAEVRVLPSNGHDAWKAGRAEILTVVCLSIVSLVVALDSTILVPVLPLDLSALHWRSFRRVRQERSIFLFALGTLVACFSHGFPQFLAGRTIQGVGGGGIVTLVLIICTDIIPLRQRPKFTSFLQVSWALGTVSGPLIGAAFAEYVSWRWIFYINFPICGIGGVMAFLVIRFRDRHKSWATKFSEVDWIGGLLFIGSTTAFLLGITWGGVQYAWNSYQTLLPLLLGIVGVVTTLFWEVRHAKNPFIRKALFNNLSGLSAYTCALLQGLLVRLVDELLKSGQLSPDTVLEILGGASLTRLGQMAANCLHKCIECCSYFCSCSCSCFLYESVRVNRPHVDQELTFFGLLGPS